jgi:hypothetical protein
MAAGTQGTSDIAAAETFISSLRLSPSLRVGTDMLTPILGEVHVLKIYRFCTQRQFF